MMMDRYIDLDDGSYRAASRISHQYMLEAAEVRREWERRVCTGKEVLDVYLTMRALEEKSSEWGATAFTRWIESPDHPVI